MAVVEKWVAAPLEDCWAIVADARSHAYWVVGSHDVRAVEGDWPEVGATFHHTQGHGPVKLSDTSTVLECEPPHRILMEVRVRPFIVAHVEMTFRADREGTCIRMDERVEGGMARMVPRPLTGPFIGVRNVEALRRLAGMAWARAAALDRAPDDQGRGGPAQDADVSGTTPRSSARRTKARA